MTDGEQHLTTAFTEISILPVQNSMVSFIQEWSVLVNVSPTHKRELAGSQTLDKIIK